MRASSSRSPREFHSCDKILTRAFLAHPCKHYTVCYPVWFLTGTFSLFCLYPSYIVKAYMYFYCWMEIARNATPPPPRLLILFIQLFSTKLPSLYWKSLTYYFYSSSTEHILLHGFDIANCTEQSNVQLCWNENAEMFLNANVIDFDLYPPSLLQIDQSCHSLRILLWSKELSTGRKRLEHLEFVWP